MGEHWRAAETAVSDRGARSHNRAYLLVVESGSSSIHPLPHPGVVTIGRAPDADLRVDHGSVSRHHARIMVHDGELRICDTGSRNGTLVNGGSIDGVRVLVTGDVIAIGEVWLIVHAELAREVSHLILDELSWRHRLEQEVTRAVGFERSLAVLAISHAQGVGPGGVGAALRAIDVIGRCDNGELLALLPEADPAAAHQLAGVLLEAVRGVAPDARIGLATCPLDAVDPDNLVLAARAAASATGDARITTAAEAARRITLGDREVLVCHPAMVRVFDLLARLARADLPVLIIGETGVGKENAAYAVHHYSARSDKPFVAINCATLPEQLVESQLFGHDKGAFTGATSARAGLFETASGGTLFLDEIGELAPGTQAKLLRALETRRITRVGETRERAVDLRIVAATNRSLDKEVEARRFREDLYFRLGSAHVHLPPLRERRCEIPMLFREFVHKAAVRGARSTPEVAAPVIQRLLAHRWPGNVRELKHVADFVTATLDGDRIEPDQLPDEIAQLRSPAALLPPTPPAGAPMRKLADELEEIERLRMTEALTRANGIKTKAAALLGMPIRTFNMRVKQYGL